MIRVFNAHKVFFKILLILAYLTINPVMAHDNAKQLTKITTAKKVMDQKVTALQNSDSVVDNQTVKIFNLELKERKVFTGSKTIRVSQGDLVRLVWKADEPAKLHLHGYDIEFLLSTNKLNTIQFTANASGRFAITSHSFVDNESHGHQALIYVEVYPD